MALNRHGIDLKAIRRDQKAIDALPNKGRAKSAALDKVKKEHGKGEYSKVSFTPKDKKEGKMFKKFFQK